MAMQLWTPSKWSLIGGPLVSGDIVLKRSLDLQPFLFPSYALANEMSSFAVTPWHNDTLLHYYPKMVGPLSQ